MKLDEGSYVDGNLIHHYSGKIFGFALSKTGHHHNAEDLAQEILISLSRSLQKGKTIDNMDAWVYKICCYTWTNYVAKELRHWKNENIDRIQLEVNPMETVEDREETRYNIERLEREIAYLSKLNRQIFVLHYYDGKSIAQIAKLLHLPQGTVKWHLFEVRKKVKEGMVKMMNVPGKISFKPIKLWGGYSGSPGANNEPIRYFQSLLAQNIFVAAYEKPLTIEEIARKVGAASAYIEECIEQFEHSELIVHVGKGKYRTNFVIDQMDNYAREWAYLKEAAEWWADEFYDCIAAKLNDIRGIGFYGRNLPDHRLLWTLLPFAIWYQYYQRTKDEAYYAKYQPDERKDGGRYIVHAGIDYTSEEFESSIAGYDIFRKYKTRGIKDVLTGRYAGVQMDTWWTGLNRRDFSGTDVMEMSRIVNLIELQSNHDEDDKMLISNMAAKGFISNCEGKLECLVPFFKAEQYRQLVVMLDEALGQVQLAQKLEQVHDDFVAMWEAMAPSFIETKDIVYKAIQRGTWIIFAVMEYLERTGRIKSPADDEKAGLMTMMVLTE